MRNAGPAMQPPGPPQPPAPPGQWPAIPPYAGKNQEIIWLLRSIRSMVIFFTVLAILGIIGGIISAVELVHAANNSGTTGF